MKNLINLGGAIALLMLLFSKKNKAVDETNVQTPPVIGPAPYVPILPGIAPGEINPGGETPIVPKDNARENNKISPSLTTYQATEMEILENIFGGWKNEENNQTGFDPNAPMTPGNFGS